MFKFRYPDFLLGVWVLGCLCLFGSCQEAFDPCVNHTVVTGPWRNIAFNIANFPLCDNPLAGKWTRFTGVGGDRLIEQCYTVRHCGSYECVRLGFGHPNLTAGIVSGTMYTMNGAYCTYRSMNAKVLACSGGFYVYFLPALTCPGNYALHHSNCSIADCGPLAECVDDGRCVCIAGYRLPSGTLPVNESYGCTDIDECAENKDNCDANSDCVNTAGYFNCSCHPGYQPPNNTRASTSNPCQDIDECVEEPDICGPNANCSNTVGSHMCTCRQGYHILPEGARASIANPCRDPCVNHTVVTGPWRNIAFNIDNFVGFPLCDSPLAGKWTRFTGVGGDRLTEQCYAIRHCGSYGCVRLGFGHPNLGAGIVLGTMYMMYGGNCAYHSMNAKVLACSGGFYVYFLPALTCLGNYALHHSNCSIADCGPLAECVDDGRCDCIAGYRLPPGTLPVNESYGCTDIDECAENKDNCDANSDCVNTAGYFNCSCHPGYQPPNNTRASTSNPCQDIDECVEEPDICGPNADCTNTVGSHGCTCHQGYEVLPEGARANITNPCRDPCENHVVVTGPWRNIAFNIDSFVGFPLCDSPLAGKWTRFTGVGGDRLTEQCYTIRHCGSYECVRLGFGHPNLGAGIVLGTMYTMYGSNCAYRSMNAKVLACSGGFYVYFLPALTCPGNYALNHSNCSIADCGPLAECVDDGKCICIAGYRLPPDTLPVNESYGCTDIDECAENKANCDANSDCVNTAGYFNCSCHPGYQTPNNTRASTSNPCQDIDECVEEPDICGPNANCSNTVGSHGCTCHHGYHVLPAGARANITNPCQDVDECATTNCGQDALCYNTPGSYYCSCKEGYIATTGFTWEYGVSVCKSVKDKIASINPPQGQTREVAFLKSISQGLVMKPDIILPPGTVAGVLSTVLLVADDIGLDNGPANTGGVANMVLDVSERLMSTLIEPTSKEYRKLVKTPIMEINFQIIGPAWKTTKIPELNVKGNTMTLDNLAPLAGNNNGSASAVLLSVTGMEKLMSASFFKSENATELYSDIITATLPKSSYTQLAVPVNFTVRHKKEFQAGLVTCVYWEERGDETHWSMDGCTTSYSNDTHTVCSCSHLSTFAILLQTGEQEEDSPLLEKVNLFCMCVGLAFLALAILTFLLCTWNPKVNNTARLHLSICLFLGHLLFLVGVSRTKNEVVCAVIAGLLHFLFLAGFVWMLLETLQLFLLVRSLTKVQVIQKEGLKALYLLLIGYGIPMVIVGVSAAVFSDGYGSNDACWLRDDRSFRWSFIGPVCSVLAINVVSFCVILWSLRPTLANMKSDVSQSRDTRLIVFKIVAQFFILGCTWILGFFQDLSVFLKYIFIILNSQQGTFIFIVHCLLNKEVREEYKRWFSCLFRKKEPSANRGSANSIPTVQQ